MQQWLPASQKGVLLKKKGEDSSEDSRDAFQREQEPEWNRWLVFGSHWPFQFRSPANSCQTGVPVSKLVQERYHICCLSLACKKLVSGSNLILFIKSGYCSWSTGGLYRIKGDNTRLYEDPWVAFWRSWWLLALQGQSSSPILTLNPTNQLFKTHGSTRPWATLGKRHSLKRRYGKKHSAAFLDGAEMQLF